MSKILIEALTCIIENYLCEVESAIEYGTLPPNRLTNGDVIEAMFPNGDLHDYDYYDGYIIYELNYRDFKFDRDWWNAPYKVGE